MSQAPYKYFQPDRVGRLANLSLLARQAVEGFIAGLHRSPHRGFSVEFTEHREYVRGDDLRHLDWVAWGRSDRYYLKQYEQQTNLRTYILLDVSRSMAYRHGQAVTKFAYGCFLTACLSYLMARQQDMVSVTAFDEKIRFHLPCGSTPAHVDRIFRRLEAAAPGGRTAIATTFHELARRLAKKGLVIIISDLYDDPDEVFNALQHLVYKKHQIIIFHLLDEAELDLPFRGVVRLVDMETDQRLQVDCRYVRDAYRREMEAFRDRYRHDCAERNIEYAATTTATPYDRMLLDYLARRRLLMKKAR
jgi:uncharacterized protein (DUF58 family)